jgi:hypothetical protein
MSEFTRYPNRLEIAAECARIQSEWTAEERHERQQGGLPLWFVGLLLDAPSRRPCSNSAVASGLDAAPDPFVPALAYAVVAAHAAL